MTGEELRQLIKGAGMSLTDMAKELGITPQNLNARLNRRSVKYEFVKEVQNIISKECPAMDISVTNSAIVGNNSNVSQNYVDSALIHQNTLLMEQNRILMDQVRSLIRTIEKMNHDKE